MSTFHVYFVVVVAEYQTTQVSIQNSYSYKTS